MYEDVLLRVRNTNRDMLLYYLSTFQQEWNYFIVSHLQQIYVD